MNRFAFLGAALALTTVACDDLGTKTGDTGCPAEPKVVTITGGDINCDTTTQVTFTVNTTGVPEDGTVFSQETGNTTPNWSDEHDLVVSSADACGQDAELTQTLATGAAVADWAPNQSTVFQCTADTHFDADVMTYAFRVYDDTGALLDCLVAGNNPGGLIDGSIDRVNDPSNPTELAGCATGSLSAAY